MFSVIIPLYNKGAYVEKAIRSVAAQTFQDFELIVVDDGSTDDSLHNAQFIIQNLELQDPDQSKKIQLIQQKNQGVSTARNNGVKLAKYDYIAFLDADDWWEPDYLSEMKALIEAYPEAGIYGSSYYKVKNGRNIPANIGVEPGFKSGLINYCRVYAATFYMPLWTGATVIRKIVFEEQEGFRPSLILGEDFYLWIHVALKYPVAFLNQTLAYYNQDVEVAHKAVVGQRIYKPEEIYIFHLDDLAEEEKVNPDLKQLLDLLRVYTLERYRLQQAYPDLVKKEINKVNFAHQRQWFWFVYHCPVTLLRMCYRCKHILRTILKR